MQPQTATVKKVRQESHDTWTLELEPPGGEPFRFVPGQFNMLYAFGVGESAISISGDPDRPQTLVHTIRAVGAVTERLCAMKRGDVIGVRGPFGRGWPLEAARGRDLLIVAGGIGLAPLKPAIHAALNDRDVYGQVAILFGARSTADLIFQREVHAWRSRFDVHVEVTVDRGNADWHGDVGLVTTLISRVPFDPARATALVCGPEIMMQFAARELQSRGVRRCEVYLTMERNMKCGIGLCGHCQLGPHFLCKDGPVFRHDELGPWLTGKEL